MYFQLLFYHPPAAIIIRFSALLIAVVIGLLLLNFMGQRLIDKKNQVFHSVYFGTNWYLMPPKLRRWIHIIINCSTNCSGLTAGKMGDLSLESAGIVIFIIIILVSDRDLSNSLKSRSEHLLLVIWISFSIKWKNSIVTKRKPSYDFFTSHISWRTIKLFNDKSLSDKFKY